MFVDDTLSFCKTFVEEIQTIKTILFDFDRLSGLLVDYMKSLILLPHNLCTARKLSKTKMLGVQPMLEGFKYQGMPIFW